jgi:hypothetical protein
MFLFFKRIRHISCGLQNIKKKKTVEIQQSGKNNKATNNNKEKLKL